MGSIEEGFAADLILYDINQPRLSGCHYSAMSPLMAGEPSYIKASFVNGKIVYKHDDEDKYSDLVREVRDSIMKLNQRIARLEAMN